MFRYFSPVYLLSLPERAVRAMAAGLGGLLFEVTQVILPGWLRRSRLYQTLVFRLFRLVVEWVGDVQGVFPNETIKVGELAVRKTLGNVIELAGFAALGWSPLWLLAAISDLTGGTRVYLAQLVVELKRDGLLPEEGEIQSIDELLNVLQGSSRVAADLVDVPPTNLAQLQESWQALKKNASNLPDAASLGRFYQHMQDAAAQHGRSVLELSALAGVGALRAGVKLGSIQVFEYYEEIFRAIRTEGWWVYTLRTAQPYVLAVKRHFDPKRETATERMLGGK